MRLFLDTNVIVIGAADLQSPEGRILRWIGYTGEPETDAELVMTPILQLELRRVARRLQNKDWAGLILHRLWANCKLVIVTYEPSSDDVSQWSDRIPREDVGIYLTAVAGKTSHFVSGNHELVRSIAAETQAFNCYHPDTFISTYIDLPDKRD